MPSAEFLNIYQRLISTSSISSSDPSWDQSNSDVIEILATCLEKQGFNIEIVEVAPGKQNLIAKRIPQYQQHSSLSSAESENHGGLLLAGHTDTVPFDQGRWQFDPLTLTIKDNRFYGLGTADMKGFFAFIVEAVSNIDWRKQRKPLYIFASCDEETSMLGAQHFSNTASIKPDYCLIGEPTNLVPINAHKGHTANAIRVMGQSGHSSDPSLGVNAIEIMQEILFKLLKLRTLLIEKYHHPGFAVPHPTLNLGHIHGGDSANRICGCCELHYDIRPLPGMSLDGLEALVREALKEVEQRWPNRVTITPLHQAIPGYECNNSPLFINDIETISGKKAESVNYCTEAPFLQHLCPTLVLGPGSIDQAHQPNEFLECSFIEPTLMILSKTINKYCF